MLRPRIVELRHNPLRPRSESEPTLLTVLGDASHRAPAIVRPRASVLPTLTSMAVRRDRKARAARRRKRRMDRVEHDLSDEQWLALKQAWGGCAYCGAIDLPLQRDCVQALSRGGRYTLDNVVPACRSCNTSKCSDEVTVWLRRRRLDERAFLLRHLEIMAAFEQQLPS
jgi:5-methylcytosine-specific restriction endonuclease McrA